MLLTQGSRGKGTQGVFGLRHKVGQPEVVRGGLMHPARLELVDSEFQRETSANVTRHHHVPQTVSVRIHHRTPTICMPVTCLSMAHATDGDARHLRRARDWRVWTHAPLHFSAPHYPVSTAEAGNLFLQAMFQLSALLLPLSTPLHPVPNLTDNTPRPAYPSF